MGTRGAATPADSRPVRSVPAWTGPVYLTLGVLTVPWIVLLVQDYLATPRRCPNPAVRCGAFTLMSLRQYNLAWAGFDVVLAVMLLVTGWLALRKRDTLPIPASITGALLFVDAWFDVMTSPKGSRTIALAEAVFVELPLAALCIWIAGRAERARQQRLAAALRPLHAGAGPDTDPR